LQHGGPERQAFCLFKGDGTYPMIHHLVAPAATPAEWHFSLCPLQPVQVSILYLDNEGLMNSQRNRKSHKLRLCSCHSMTSYYGSLCP
jgi:hypothetical protein